MTGLSRYTRILRLFSDERHILTVPEIAAALGVPASTIYRTVREMVREQFLENATEAQYRLGAFFVEFDRLVRVTDPLQSIGTSLLRDVILQARVPCVAVLARLYGDTVMCVAGSESQERSVRTSYERGSPRPLTRGATSKAILAQLPTRRLTKLLEAAKEPEPFPKSTQEIREELALIRRRGYSVTRGEVDKGLVGIAAPVSLPELGLLGSLSLVVEAASLDDALERRLVLLTVSSASLLREEFTHVERPENHQDRALR